MFSPKRLQLELHHPASQFTDSVVGVDNQPTKDEDGILRIDAHEAVIAGFVEEQVLHPVTLGRV